MSPRRAGTDQVARAVADLVDEAFRVASDVEHVVSAALVVAGRERRSVSRSDLGCVEDAVTASLTSPGSRIQGAGFVTAVDLLVADRWWLEWFLRSEGGPTRLEVETDEHATGFHDYERLAWYAVPRDSGSRHVVGPYVDNLCTEDYTLTFTQPVVVDGAFCGVSGADIGVRAAERALLPSLRAVEEPVAVLNDEGRVLVSNTGTAVCGELLAKTQWHRGVRVAADVPLLVAHLRR